MELTDKYEKMLDTNDEELQKIIDILTEEEAKIILCIVMSQLNKGRRGEIEF